MRQKYPQTFNNNLICQNSLTPKSKKNKQKKVIISSSNISNKNNVEHTPKQVIQFQTEFKQKDDHFYYRSKDQKITKVKSKYQKIIPHCSSIKNIYTKDTKASDKEENSFHLAQTIKQLQKKIIRLQKEIYLKDKKICQLELVSKQFLKSNSFFSSQNHANKQYLHQNYQVDLKRLLRMLQATDEYKCFSSFAIDDGGVKFLHQVNKTVKTKIDLQKQRKPVHYCMCNKQYIAQSGLWVPQSIYTFGKQFIKDCQQNMTKSQYQLLLYQLNKLWRQRQKRIINTLKQEKNGQIQKYKRKLNICSTQRQKTSSNTSKFKLY